MKLVGTLLVILGAVVIVGCGSSAPRVQVPVGIMQVAEEELSHSIGTTTLTSAVVAPVTKAARAANPGTERRKQQRRVRRDFTGGG